MSVMSSEDRRGPGIAVRRLLQAAAFALVVAGPLAACENKAGEGPAEQAGKAVDNAAEKAADAVGDAVGEVKAGTEKAVEAVGDAAGEVKEGAEKAAEGAQEAAKEATTP